MLKRTRLAAAALTLWAAAGRVSAEDGVVTIQYLDEKKKGIYQATGLLEDDTLEAVHAAFPASKGHTWNTARGESINDQTKKDLAENHLEVKKVLSQLADGDVLVLNMHSDVTQAGYSTAEGATDAVPWQGFYAKFGITRAPRLALVIVNGCMGSESGKATDDEVEALRCALNATALVCARTTIDTIKSQKELVDLLEGLDSEKKVVVPAGPTFGIVVSRLVEKEQASLAELRNRAKLVGARSEVTKETEDRDVVTAVEDEPNPLLIASDAVVVPWQNRDKKRSKGWTSIRFDFDPRREIERVEFVLRVHAPISAQNDSFRGDIDGRPIHLIEKFRVTKDNETTELKKEWDARGMGGWGPLILKQIQSGKLRCALGDSTFLEGATLVVFYAGVRK